MAFSHEEIEALIAELQRDPQLRDRLRGVILADDFLALPRIVADLAAQVGELVQSHRRLEERMDQLTGRVDALTVQMAGLALQVAELTKSVQSHDGRLGNLEGDMYEIKYDRRLPSRLGERYMKVRPVHVPDIEPVSRAYGTQLAASEWTDLLEIDVAAFAQLRTVGGEPSSPEVLVVLELSRTVNAEDVRRIHRRAEILRRLGLNVEAAVDGEWIRSDAREVAEQLGVVTLVVREPQAA